MKSKKAVSIRPTLSAELVKIADNLALFAMEFGVPLDDNFDHDLATLGFINCVRLRIHAPSEADNLEALIAAESIPADEELVGLTAGVVAAFSADADLEIGINHFLRERWRLSADNTPTIASDEELFRRILHGIRFGLLVAKESPETAQKIEEHATTLGCESRFLSLLLYYWRDNDWKPNAVPFVEFTASCYEPGSIQQRMIRYAVSEIHPFAKALNQPWRLSFWAEMGWSGGRGFVRKNPKDCTALLAEVGRETLQVRHAFYQQHLLGTARSDGEIQIERATLKYFGTHPDADLARCYCTGGEPRRLARLGFDFAFWMGIFSSHPVPIIEH